MGLCFLGKYSPDRSSILGSVLRFYMIITTPNYRSPVDRLNRLLNTRPAIPPEGPGLTPFRVQEGDSLIIRGRLTLTPIQSQFDVPTLSRVTRSRLSNNETMPAAILIWNL
jgi:hypothetical protein